METLLIAPFTEKGRINCELFPSIVPLNQYIHKPSAAECLSDFHPVSNNKGAAQYNPFRPIFYKESSTLVRPVLSAPSMLKSSNQLSEFSDETIKLENDSNVYVSKYEDLNVDDTFLYETSREFRNQLGSEDSSYDSDCDVDNVSFQLSSVAEHEDVSRQVSDTLGAEFSEYVTLGCNELSDKLSLNVEKLSPDKVIEEIIQDNLTDHPNYATKVEFGLKLGYPESLVHSALLKLGGEAGQNELLEELIKLGASVKVADLSEKKDVPVIGEGVLNLKKKENDVELRHIVIDGSNVAMSHGNKEVFSCKGIKICVDWFKVRGHTDITVFVPKWRKETTKPDSPITDQDILLELEKERLLVFTPSRLVGGRRLVCYDDRYILKLAAETDGVVVSNDNYRDLAQENQDFKKVVEDRILMYSFVNDRFMPPDDPLGRNGPTLDNFLCKKIKPSEIAPLSCPYAKKCTYGNKCKYYHPERGNQPQKSITERLHENAQKQIFEAKSRNKGEIFRCKSLGICNDGDTKKYKKMPLSRTKSSIPCVNLPEGLGSKQFHKTSKSNSVEKISKDKMPLASSKSIGNQASQPRFRIPHGQTYLGDPSQLGGNSEHMNQDINTHAKLRRQLTLNPCYDPRINQIRVQYANQFSPRADSGQRSNLSVSGCVGSDYQVYNMRHWPDPSGAMHSSLTRISSAPDSCQANLRHPQHYHSRTMHRLSSTSDSQLNLFNGAIEALTDPFDSDYLTTDPGTVNHSSWENVPFNCASHCKQDDSRSKLYYHLSSLFPEEQVKIAMKMYPDELNPQKICAVILGMFPK